MLTYVFPGQGSQRKGMGKELFDEFPEETRIADSVLGYSIQELCVLNPKRELNKTQFTQPALFIVNALTYLKKIKEDSRRPDFLAGHSLGEYNALFAAGVFDFETGVRLVQKRGKLMSEASGGGMAAVLGLREEKVRELLSQNNLSTIDIANCNGLTQIVLAGSQEDLGKGKDVFEAVGEGIRYLPLNVSAPFHSRYMKPAEREFSTFLRNFRFNHLQIPVISNVVGTPYRNDEIEMNLAKQITHSVKWTESMWYLLNQNEGIEIEEVGPGDVLTKMVKRIREEERPTPPPVQEKIAQAPSAVQTAPSTSASSGMITPTTLGSEEFKRDYNVKYAYISGAMVKAIASKEIVVSMGKAGFLGFYGTGGMRLHLIEEAIQYIQRELSNGESYGMNLLCNMVVPQQEDDQVDLFLKYGVQNLEAAAYIQITPSLVRYRLKGLKRDGSGKVIATNRLIAKVSRPEVATSFLSPAPERILKKLLSEGKITQEEVNLSKEVPMADDICVEADSGGHTDQGVAYALMPAMIRLRDEMVQKFGYTKSVRIGAAGGIGTPESAGAAFILGADFVLTGSINQCTVEAGTSDAVKDLLEQINVQDTEYAPAGDMFEIGARVQVVKKGVFFPARANKLYDLYRRYNSLEEIDEKTRTQIQEKYFKRSFDDVYAETKAYYLKNSPQEIEKAERNPKAKMALIFRWYFVHTNRLALSGSKEQKVDYQIHCGPALGAFNQWVKGTSLESWRNRHVDQIGLKLMEETASLLSKRFQSLSS